MAVEPMGVSAGDPRGGRDKPWGLATIVGGAGPEPAVLRDDRLAPLCRVLPGAAPSPPGSLREMLADWDRWVQVIDDSLAGVDPAAWSATRDATLLAPIPDPPGIYCCGANYYDHVAEMVALIPELGDFRKDGESVFHFLLPAGSLVADRSPVVRPAGARQLDWEVELAAVIGRRADRVPVDEALGHVAAYTVANDISLRDPGHRHRLFGVNFLMAMVQRALTPVGPALVPARFVADVQELELSLTVNGVTRQRSSTAQMIWSLAEQIAELSGMVALEPGDLILTGTPAGTAAAHGTYLEDGDEMVATISGLGSLHNRIHAAASLDPTRG